MITKSMLAGLKSGDWIDVTLRCRFWSATNEELFVDRSFSDGYMGPIEYPLKSVMLVERVEESIRVGDRVKSLGLSALVLSLFETEGTAYAAVLTEGAVYPVVRVLSSLTRVR